MKTAILLFTIAAVAHSQANPQTHSVRLRKGTLLKLETLPPLYPATAANSTTRPVKV